MSDESTITEAQRKALATIRRAEAKHADEDGFVSLLALKGVREETLTALSSAGLVERRADGSAAEWVRLTEAAQQS